MQSEFRRGIAELRGAVDVKIDSAYADACVQRAQGAWQARQQQTDAERAAQTGEAQTEIRSLRVSLQRVEAAVLATASQSRDLGASDSTAATALLPSIDGPRMQASMERLDANLEALRADHARTAVLSSSLSQRAADQELTIAEQFSSCVARTQQLETSVTTFRAYAEPILQRMDSSAPLLQLSARAHALPTLDTRSSTPTASAYQQPAYAGQTFVHTGQWRKHKLLEYWSCCQTPATGNKDAIGCSLREEPTPLAARARHGSVAPLPSPASALPPTPTRTASSVGKELGR